MDCPNIQCTEPHSIYRKMKRNKIFIPATKTEDWQQLLADPEKHWKIGFSARAMAYCWQEANGIPKEIQKVLSQTYVFNKLEPLIVIPEHQVPLPGGSRPSQNDCWVLARTPHDLVSIAVEGKVSETFGPTIGEWYSKPLEGKTERLNYLCSQIGLNDIPPDDIRYQLLHRTASAVIEANRFFAKHAVMVVHSFSQKAEWIEDYKKFAELFKVNAVKNTIVSVGTIKGVDLYLAWVTGNKRFLEL